MFIVSISCVVGTFSNNLNVIELDVSHKKAKKNHKDRLQYGHFKKIWDKDHEKDRSVWSGSFESKADDGH